MVGGVRYIKITLIVVYKECFCFVVSVVLATFPTLLPV